MAISKVIFKSSADATPEVWMDATPATAAATDIMAPKTAMLADGVLTTGTGSGGGSVEVEQKDVNFIDYDGTILYSYTKAEFANLSALPANPSHTGLTAQGWNWSLSDAKTYVATYGKLWIGQMYVTSSNDTEIDIELTEGRLSPYLGIAVNGTVDVDWGDGSTHSTVTGSSLTTQIRTLHNYSVAGKYTIAISVTNGSFAFYGTDTYFVLSKNSSVARENYVYADAVYAVRIGSNCSIGNYAFIRCVYLQSVTMPHGLLNMGQYAFQYCYKLKCFIYPDTCTSLPSSMAGNCYSLQYVSISKSITSTSNSIFASCYSLHGITLSDSITTLYSIVSSTRIKEYIIPNGVTSLETQAFYQMYDLTTITIPSSVTSIGQQVFYNNGGLKEIHFQSTSPPTASNSNTFTNLPTDCIIYVPTGYLSAYTSANNYPSSSTYTYVEEA